MSASNVGKRCRWTTARPGMGVIGKPTPAPDGPKMHEGEIVAHVAAGSSLRENEHFNVYLDTCPVTGEPVRVDANDVVAFDRYLVREDRRGINVRGDGGRVLAPKWYAPRCSKVEVL